MNTSCADTCIVNFYPVADARIEAESGRLGVHVDKDEDLDIRQRGDPIVSISVGDSADFAYGPVRFNFDENGHPVLNSTEESTASTQAENAPATVRLESGDLLVFGGPSRMIHHGVSRIVPHTSPEWLHMVGGRVNFTFRCTGRGEAY